MTFLADTDRVAEYLKGRPEAVRLLREVARQGLAISLITFGEIYEGLYFGHNRERHEEGFRAFLGGVDILPLTRPIMQRFALMRGTLRQAGQLIGDFDILIASTALHHDLTIITGNIADFRRFPGLKIYGQ